MNETLLIVGMAAVTYIVRYPVLSFLGRLNLSRGVLRALGYVPVAVLTAITVPAALMPDDRLDVTPDNAYLVGALVAVVVAWRTHNLLATIVIGMVAFLLWRGLVG